MGVSGDRESAMCLDHLRAEVMLDAITRIGMPCNKPRTMGLWRYA
jgi:hypothetical protein